MGRRRVLITGVSRFLGLRLAKRLEHDDGIEQLVGVDLEEPPLPIDNLEFVRADIGSPLVARVLEATKVDAVVHTNITASPRRFGGRSRMKENNVIGTMQLLGAAQRSRRITKVVVRSSTAVYGLHPGEPSLITEDHAAEMGRLSGYARDCAEAETFARDFGRRRPDVGLVILRSQSVVGPTVTSSMTQYFSLPIIPTALGFDPRIQLLHEEDAIDSLVAALGHDARGIFNVAADGVVYLSKAIRMLGATPLPLPSMTGPPVAALLRRLGLVDFPDDQLKRILFGRVVDTRRTRESLGFVPSYSTEDCIRSFRDERGADILPEDRDHPAWERELFEYLRQKSADRAGVT